MVPSSVPRLAVTAARVRRGAGDREWLVTWRIRNDSRRAMRLTSSWLPHGRFRGPTRAHRRTIGPGAEVSLELPVRFAERAGAVVENAFLILRLSREGERWRTLARMTVRAGADGAPSPKVETTRYQRVGATRRLGR